MMQKQARRVIWILAISAALLIVAVILANKRQEISDLPLLARYDQLPGAFNQALQHTHARIRSQGKSPEAVRQLARLYQANRLFKEARACFSAIALMPGRLSARDHYYLADIAQNENVLAEAQTELRSVLIGAPQYLPARLALAEALFKSGQSAEAAKEYSAILATEAEQPQALLGLARIELQRGDDDSAVVRLEELMASHPESTSGAALFARILERRGEADRAAAMTQWSGQKPEPIPPDPWMFELLGDTYDVQRLALRFEDYFRTGQIPEATGMLNRLEKLDPQGALPLMLKGWLEMQARRDADAVRLFRQALAKGGDPEKLAPVLVQCMLRLGTVAEAADLMADMDKRLPNSIAVTKAYSEVAIRARDEALAQGLLEKILLREPYLPAQNMSLARILWTAGDRASAVLNLQRVAQAMPGDVPSRALLGEFYLDQSDPGSAIPPLEQAIKHASIKTPAHESLTELLTVAYLKAGAQEQESNRLDEAQGYFEKAIGIAPRNLSGYAGLADICTHLKQYRRAADALGKMLSLQSDNPTIYLSLGDVLYQDGDKAQASRHWQKALQLAAGGDTELQRALTDRLNGRINNETFK